MSRNKKHRGRPEGTEGRPAKQRNKTTDRRKLIMSIVDTDSTFKSMTGVNAGWVGDCIHCGTRLFVSVEGATLVNVTVEHINPKCNAGDKTDPRNLALACASCNNEKGVRHDRHVGKNGHKSHRADEVIEALKEKRLARWREPTEA